MRFSNLLPAARFLLGDFRVEAVGRHADTERLQGLGPPWACPAGSSAQAQ